MEYFGLVFLHVFFAILWAGGAVAVGLFVIPSVMEAGPAGGVVMAGVMTVSGVVVVLTGLRLYMLRFDPAWIGTPEGIVISLGAIVGLGALVLGIMVQKPPAEKLGVARLTAFHLIAASLLMASHGLAAVM